MKDKGILCVLFSNRDLRNLIIPIVIDQFLQAAVGIADSVMVASVGEAAVSGVSLIDMVIILMIFTSMAFSTGGAVVAGQYLGKQQEDMACRVANELVLFTCKAFLAITLLGYIGKDLIIGGLFGEIEADVAYNCEVYLLIVFASIPMIALYNAGAAILRAMGDASVVMKASLLMNGINVGGNALFIYGFHFGIEGVAIPTLVSRLAACIMVLILLCDQKRRIHIVRPFSVRTNSYFLKKILYIGIPNAIENGMFQLGKLLVLSMIARFGTAAIAANAVASSLERFVVLPGNSIGLGLQTVCAQCMGQGDHKQVDYYTRKLVKWTYIMMAAVNLSVLLLLPLILMIYGLSAEASGYVRQIMIYHTFCTIAIWPLTFSLPYMLRAVGDVHFTLFWSVVSMWVFRIGSAWLLGVKLGWGVFGVWVAMTIDWLFRSVCFVSRYISGKWKHPSLV